MDLLITNNIDNVALAWITGSLVKIYINLMKDMSV